jgi:hypothetical protein
MTRSSIQLVFLDTSYYGIIEHPIVSSDSKPEAANRPALAALNVEIDEEC